jgi:hypothetical protein
VGIYPHRVKYSAAHLGKDRVPCCSHRVLRARSLRYSAIMLARILLFAGLLIPAHALSQSFAPPAWDERLKLNELVDSNADPKIVEVTLVAKLADVEIAPGKRVSEWTYNGWLPGPSRPYDFVVRDVSAAQVGPQNP